MEAYYNDAKTAILVVLEDGAAEEFTIDEFIATYGEEALPGELPSKVYEPNPKIYWGAAVDLVNAWSKYQAVKKLQINAMHEETRHKVDKVVQKHYSGSIQKIMNRRYELSEILNEEIEGFSNICSVFDVEPVNRYWLHDHLRDAKDYASLREKCKRRKNRARPVVALSKI